MAVTYLDGRDGALGTPVDGEVLGGLGEEVHVEVARLALERTLRAEQRQ